MNDILKQRLVGALILLALGIVFWPIIFVEPGERASLDQGRIPLPPRIDRSPIEPPRQGSMRASPDWQAEPAEVSEDVLQESPQGIGEPVTSPVNPDADPAPAVALAEEPHTRTGAPEKPELDEMGVSLSRTIK